VSVWSDYYQIGENSVSNFVPKATQTSSARDRLRFLVQPAARILHGMSDPIAIGDPFP
jgi:hypothetical protein